MNKTERQLIETLMNALEHHVQQTRPIQNSLVAIEKARDYLSRDENCYEGSLFSTDQWWFQELRDVAKHGTANQNRAVSIVKQLIRAYNEKYHALTVAEILDLVPTTMPVGYQVELMHFGRAIERAIEAKSVSSQ